MNIHFLIEHFKMISERSLSHCWSLILKTWYYRTNILC